MNVNRKVRKGSISTEEMRHIRRMNEKFTRLSLSESQPLALNLEKLEFFPKLDELVYAQRESDKRWFVARVVATATDKGAVIVEFKKVSLFFFRSEVHI